MTNKEILDRIRDNHDLKLEAFLCSSPQELEEIWIKMVGETTRQTTRWDLIYDILNFKE